MGFDDSMRILYITESVINEMKNKIPEDGNQKELSIELKLKDYGSYIFSTANIKTINVYNSSDGKAVLSNPFELGISLNEFKDAAKAGATQIALLVK